jgi:hypothetical protein
MNYLGNAFNSLFHFQCEQGMGHDASDELYLGERIETTLKQLNTIQVGNMLYNK